MCWRTTNSLTGMGTASTFSENGFSMQSLTMRDTASASWTGASTCAETVTMATSEHGKRGCANNNLVVDLEDKMRIVFWKTCSHAHHGRLHLMGVHHKRG